MLKDLPRQYDMTVRVGCSLVYEASGPATLMLNVQPFAGRNHQVVFQSILLGNDLIDAPFVDSHGNHVHRVSLERGTNCIRHDAIVAVSSEPDNAGLRITRPLSPEALPSEVMRYAMPSRYCDSDKLADFAWEKFGQIEHGLPRVDAISQWVHKNIEYRYLSGRPDLSAWDILQRGYGVWDGMLGMQIPNPNRALDAELRACVSLWSAHVQRRHRMCGTPLDALLAVAKESCLELPRFALLAAFRFSRMLADASLPSCIGFKEN